MFFQNEPASRDKENAFHDDRRGNDFAVQSERDVDANVHVKEIADRETDVASGRYLCRNDKPSHPPKPSLPPKPSHHSKPSCVPKPKPWKKTSIEPDRVNGRIISRAIGKIIGQTIGEAVGRSIIQVIMEIISQAIGEAVGQAISQVHDHVDDRPSPIAKAEAELSDGGSNLDEAAASFGDPRENLGNQLGPDDALKFDFEEFVQEQRHIASDQTTKHKSALSDRNFDEIPKSDNLKPRKSN